MTVLDAPMGQKAILAGTLVAIRRDITLTLRHMPRGVHGPVESSASGRSTHRRGAALPVLAVAVAAVLALAAQALPLMGAEAATPTLKDIEGSWARDAIAALVDEGIIGGYPDGTFRPDDPVTRAEFAKMVARAFALRPSGASTFPDVVGSWAESYITALSEAGIAAGYPDGTFGPARRITRAELVAMLVRVVGLGERMDSLEQPQPSFEDVTPEHWAFRAVEAANTLGIVPIHFGVVFQPDLAATRAETAWMVKALIDLKVVEGKLAAVDATEGKITVTTPGGTEQAVLIGLDTQVYRNSVATTVEKLLRGDEVRVVADASGAPKFVSARGLVTKDDVTAKVSILSKGTLTPEEVEALARGDWNSAKDGLRPKLLARLVEEGLTEEEATSILDQNWSQLGELARERLGSALSRELGVSSDLVVALLNQDWELAKTYGEIEVAQYLLSKLLNL